jgi:hypothetical protein
MKAAGPSELFALISQLHGVTSQKTNLKSVSLGTALQWNKGAHYSYYVSETIFHCAD